MADICEVCMNLIAHFEGGYIDYDSVVLCAKCYEEVEDISNFHEGEKEFEECVEILRKRKRRKNG